MGELSYNVIIDKCDREGNGMMKKKLYTFSECITEASLHMNAVFEWAARPNISSLGQKVIDQKASNVEQWFYLASIAKRVTTISVGVTSSGMPFQQ